MAKFGVKCAVLRGICARAQSFFRVAEWEAGAGFEPCVATRLPEQRRAEYGHAAALLFRDAEQTLWDMQIGHSGRSDPPSFRPDHPTEHCSLPADFTVSWWLHPYAHAQMLNGTYQLRPNRL